MRILSGIAIGILAIPFGLGAVSGEAFAQYYDPYRDSPYYRSFEPDRSSGNESFIDEYGRLITVDPYGRVVAVEERGPQGAIVLDGPPPPGAVLEGPVGTVPPRYGDPFTGQDWDSAAERPVEAQPLPAPGTEPSQTAALPPEGTDPYATGSIGPQQPPQLWTQQPESDPAPTVAGPTGPNAKAQVAAYQVILDRAGASPGVIDGQMGSNVNKAVAAYEEITGRSIDFNDPQALAEELYATGGPAVIEYTITNEDVSGPFVASIPSDYSEKALLDHMSYERVTEKLAERFHMDERYLQEINPGADFNRPGTIIKVMNVGDRITTPVVRIEADKGRKQVRGYGEDGRLVVAYPASIGSSSTPSPEGEVEVTRIALNPNYTYNPKVNFQQGENTQILTIPPGPNGPVGTVWIALSRPTYGIHGTPEPSQIGRTYSYGCIRLTNWDATELAKIVSPGVTVTFVE